MLRIAALLLLLSTGCKDPFATAQESDSIDSYEAYLTENPSGAYRIQAESRVEELMLEKARAEKSLEAYDALLTRFPNGALKEKVTEERESFLFAWADEQDTAEGYQKYLDEYPRGTKTKKNREEARRRLKMAENKDRLEVSPVTIEQVNMANDPDGPLNGWGFFADVTNVGDAPIQTLWIQVSMLDNDGNVIDTQKEPLVDTVLPGRGWAPDEFKAPLEPGETRSWKHTSGDLPAGWSRRASIKPVKIGFVKAEEK
ncbi:MAG: hypothetical protein P8R54_29710 [Myxococcota bacterium]|nr:hypothetical protein [Myxococcota bacterium]